MGDTRPNPGNPPARRPKTLGDGNHGGSSGVNRDTERMHSENFKGQGMLRPASSDGRSAGMDGVVEGKVNVPRTRIMGKQDPVAGKK